MNYRKFKKDNILENKIKNINSKTTIQKKYENKEYNINTNNTYISQYEGELKQKKLTICNVIIDKEKKYILEKNINTKKNIKSLSNSFEIEASLLSCKIKENNNMIYADLNIEIYKGQIIPNGIYQILCDNESIEFKCCIIRNDEYYEAWGHTIFFFEIEDIHNLFIYFKSAIVGDKEHINFDIQDGCVYLFESSKIKVEYEYIQNMITTEKYLHKFEIKENNNLFEHRYILLPKEKKYMLIQSHKIDKQNIYNQSLISDIVICKCNDDEIKSLYESSNSFAHKISENTIKILIFFIGIIFARYYYNLYNNKKITNLEKKYNRLESAYKYILKEKYNL